MSPAQILTTRFALAIASLGAGTFGVWALAFADLSSAASSAVTIVTLAFGLSSVAVGAVAQRLELRRTRATISPDKR